MTLDILQLRRPKIDYVSPPVCEAVFSGTGTPVIVLEPFDGLPKITGFILTFDGTNYKLTWSVYPGAVCYNIYVSDDGITFTLAVECTTDLEYVFPPGKTVRVSPITPEGEGPLSDAIFGPVPCAVFIDNTDIQFFTTEENAARENGLVGGAKTDSGIVRPWLYFNRSSSDIRTSQSSGLVQGSQSASDLVLLTAPFFVASHVGKYLAYDSGGVARKILGIIDPQTAQVSLSDTVAASTFKIRGQTLGGLTGPSGVDVVGGGGQVAGHEPDVTESFRMFWFNRNTGEIRDLGDFTLSLPVWVNTNGFLLYRFTESDFHGRIYNPNTMAVTDIGICSPTRMNNSLIVTGELISPLHAFRWQAGVMTDIHPADGDDILPSRGDFVNASGMIAGKYNPEGAFNPERVFYNVGGPSISIGSIVDPVNSSTGWTTALDLNDNGEIVGAADYTASLPLGTGRAFRWSQATGIVPLGFLPGFTVNRATSINNLGHTVGDHSSSGKACLWRAGSTVAEDLMNFLPPGSGWTSLTSAIRITNNNEVIGHGIFEGQTKQYFLKLCL